MKSLEIKPDEMVSLTFEVDGRWIVYEWYATDYSYLYSSFASRPRHFDSCQEAILDAALKGDRLFKVDRRINNVFVSFDELIDRYHIEEL